jgi:hypothetical protein
VDLYKTETETMEGRVTRTDIKQNKKLREREREREQEEKLSGRNVQGNETTKK